MVATYGSSLTTTKLDELIDGGLRRRASQVVRTTAFDVLGIEQSLAAVRTGYLKSSLQPGGPENIMEFSDNGLTAILGTAVPYGPFVNYGTRYMRAQPFVEPAIERIRPVWEQRVAGIFGDKVLGL